MGGSSFQRKHQPPTMATTIEKLPNHLLSDILIRVPARTLAQMRSVSKPMNAFLSQPSFIKSHLHRSIHNNDEILLVFKYFLSMEVTAHSTRSPHLELPNFIQLPVDKDPNDPCMGHELIGSVNGLICSSYVTDDDFIIQIWNPSISALLELPDPLPSDQFQNKIRFGYDPNKDDYKVVRLAIFALESENFALLEVFSMRTGYWKFNMASFPGNLRIFGEEKVCGDGHDGRLHWLCHDDDDDEPTLETIVAYDLGSETMSEIGLPVDYNKNRRNVVGVLGGKLCLISCLKDHSCEVWLMNEYGNAESWAKHHVFSQFSANNTSPYGFTLSSEFLFASSDVLSLYDPVAAKVKSFRFTVNNDTKIVPYVDSLVWITPQFNSEKRELCARCMVVTRKGKIVPYVRSLVWKTLRKSISNRPPN